MNRIGMVLFLWFGAVAGPAGAQSSDNTQSCNTRIQASTPASRFDFGAGSGTALDLQLNLMWQRCPLGYDLDDGGTSTFINDDRCVADGMAEFSWPEALAAAQDHNAAGSLGGFNNWRLPNMHELATITERQCHHPALNLSVFPATGDFALLQGFWSSTADTATGLGSNSPLARYWSFRLGTPSRNVIDPNGFFASPYFVRLVRTP